MPDLPLPVPLSPAQQRARREARKRVIEQQQALGFLPKTAPLARAGSEPAGKLFELSDMRRIPVLVTERARAYINASNAEGRLLPQALSEEMGSLEDEHEIDHLEVDLVPKSTHFSVSSDDYYPDGTPYQLLAIRAVFKAGAPEPEYLWLINAIHLQELHAQTREPLMSAARTAEEFVRIYKQRHRLP